MSKLLLHTTEKGSGKGREGGVGDKVSKCKESWNTENRWKFYADLKGSSDKEASLFSMVVNISNVYNIMTLVKSNNLTAPLQPASEGAEEKAGAQKGSSAA